MGAVETTYTFTATDTITSGKMNNIIDQTVMTSDSVFVGGTVEVSGGKLRVRSGSLTSNELAANSVTTNAIVDSNITTAKIENSTSASTGVTTAKIADGAVTGPKLASNAIISTLPSNFPIQIISANKTDAQSVTTSETTWIDISGLSITLTRRVASASGKVRIQASVCSSSNSGAAGVMLRIVRGASTVIGTGAAAGNREKVSNFNGYPGSTTTGTMMNSNIDFIDTSPGSDATVTYKIQSRSGTATDYYINRGDIDTDSAAYARAISTITLTELAP